MATYWENSCSFGLRYVSLYKCLIVNLVFPPRFLEWESFSDCAFSWSLPTCTFLHINWTACHKIKKVQVGKDQEKAQSERDSHSKNRGGKKPN